MEALAAFRDKPGKLASVSSPDGNTWTCMGPFFLQLPTQQVHDMLVKGRPPLSTLKCGRAVDRLTILLVASLSLLTCDCSTRS